MAAAPSEIKVELPLGGLTEDVSYVPLRSHNTRGEVTGIVSSPDVDGKHPQELS